MILAAPAHLAALPLASGEPSKVPFYVLGAVFAAWAVFIGITGLRSPKFPDTPGRTRLVMGISIVLALSAVSGAVATSKTATHKSATPTTTAARASGPGGPTVVMKNISFIPKTITVHVGQTVKWINEDSTSHNVTAANGQAFQSPTFGNGGTFTYKPTAPGRIPYVCTIHPNMVATLIVKP